MISFCFFKRVFRAEYFKKHLPKNFEDTIASPISFYI